MYGLYSWCLAEDLFKEPEESWQLRKRNSKKKSQLYSMNREAKMNKTLCQTPELL